jgi:uncharacterized lipoprotein YmbA
MRPRQVIIRWALLALVSSGCALVSSPTDRSRFFTLDSRETSAPDDGSNAGVVRALGLGPILLPAYLQRSEIVTRVGPNEIRPAGLDRWGEPLADAFARALRDDLEARLGTTRIVLHPWGAAARPDLITTVSVLRFEATWQRKAELVARWSVRRGDSSTPLVRRTSEIAEPMQGDGTGAAVEALGRAVDALSREIAEAVTAASGG